MPATRLRPVLLACLLPLFLVSACATSGAGDRAGTAAAGEAARGAGGPPGAGDDGDPAADRAPAASDRLLGAKPNYDFDIEAPAWLADDIRSSTLVGRWQRREDYDPIQFDGLVARLPDEVQAILRADGRFRGEVKVDTSPGRVRVAADPGPQVTVADVSVRIEGPARGDAEAMAQVRGVPGLAVGQPFRSRAWEGGKREILDTLNRHGFLRAAVSRSEARVDVAAGKVALDVVVESGERLAFGELEIEGLGRYDRRIVEDLRPFRPGDPFSEAKLQEFASRLRSSGYFSSVSALPDLLALQDDPDARQVRIQVVLDELARRRVVFGLGYSTDEGPRGQVGFEHRDLFGRNVQMESALVVSAKRQRAFAHFRTPYDDDNRFYGFGQRVEREDIEQLVTLRSNTYVGFGRRDGDIESFTSLQYQIERERIPAGPFGPAERNSLSALVLGKSWTLRRVDSALDPRDGYAVSLQVSGARDEVLSDRSFLRLHTRATRFQPMPAGTAFDGDTLVALFELGVVAASSRDGIPSENLFRAGGVQSIRGYAYQSLGVPRGDAIVGGRYLAIASLEYQHRLTDAYSLAAFVDYGNAGDSRSDFDPVAGYGLGLRWRTPIGPVNLDVAYGQAISRYRIHFSIGYTF
ncbi:MAG: outer membrane protein assembly factor [Burkholderiaceae bacterium]|nr:outer membrane protein assembly factor [Burkholderiaceae bacterium]